ncbi:transglutaminaseTgpA domain-containing protein [Rhodoferax aquaticus]|uniref:DUF3488 domain-containing protein n=1 Tax=Rhodoferax aquaticus TaxID=2527691 RepID=A0A515EPC1_9BURK|nr:DUF3488 and transglutaminase-like domain-containing protein [Rhodoferax aquaticus]QDL54517.1 DUF3488 domain-containing protein [Rhodoferax aquaticus]
MWLTLKTLPRDARDTLFLLLVIAWTIAPQIDNLPLWCSGMTASLLVWRGVIALRGSPMPSRWWLFAALALATAGTYFSFKTLLGRDAGVTFVIVLLALKTLEMRARRDAFVIFFLGFFALLSNFFYSQSLLTALSMLVALLGLLTALVNSHMPVGKPPLTHAARTAAWMALLGAPIMIVLFMLFPRIAPLWGVPSDAMAGRSGLSGTMQVGTIASLALDSSVAMRIKFEGRPPRQSSLYFRGPVFSAFDGRNWSPARRAVSQAAGTSAPIETSGDPIRYEVTLEGNNRPWVLVLDATPESPSLKGYSLFQTQTMQWLADAPISDIVRYKATSFTNYTLAGNPANQSLGENLTLPSGFNPRTQQLADEMRRDPQYSRADAATWVEAGMQRLRTQGYTYTLEPGVFGQHSADEFWFDKREGFCEHIASSFVVLMRALDVPARVVTGYQGGELNAVDGFWTVRQSDAHAWAEVWMGAKGWVRVDPTSAVAPGRTGSLQRLEIPQSALGQALSRVSPSFVVNLRAFWEATNNRWNQWVLNYSQAKQLNLLKNLGFESPSWEDLSYVLIALLVLASSGGALWTLWDRHRQDPWLRLLSRAHQRLTKAGLILPPQAAPRQIAEILQRMADQPPHTQRALSTELHAVSAWLLKLERWRYSPSKDRATTATLATLHREFQQLRWPKHLASSPLPLENTFS